jgi:hypothetical protein
MRFGWQQAAAFLFSMRIIRRWRPDVIVGFGGFTTSGIILVAVPPAGRTARSEPRAGSRHPAARGAGPATVSAAGRPPGGRTSGRCAQCWTPGPPGDHASPARGGAGPVGFRLFAKGAGRLRRQPGRLSAQPMGQRAGGKPGGRGDPGLLCHRARPGGRRGAHVANALGPRREGGFHAVLR